MAKIKLEDIKKECQQHGWECADTSYINLKTPMNFRCDEGHLVNCTWAELRGKFRCPVCTKNLKKKITNISATPKGEAYRILALDQSSRKTGYSIYDGTNLVAYGVYESTSDGLINRIKDVCDWLDSMIVMWQPDEVGLEETLYNQNFAQGRDGVANHDTFRLLTQVMGALIVTAARANCVVGIVKIATWRHHCGVKGRSRADQKRSAQMLVKKWHDISVTDDESDAICIGKYFADEQDNKKLMIGSEDW